MWASSKAGKGDKADKTRNVFRNTSVCSYWFQGAVATEVKMSSRVTVLPTKMTETKVSMVHKNSMVLYFNQLTLVTKGNQNSVKQDNHGNVSNKISHKCQ